MYSIQQTPDFKTINLSPLSNQYTLLVSASPLIATGSSPDDFSLDSDSRIYSDQSLGGEQTAIPEIPAELFPDDPLPSPLRTGGPIHCSMNLSSLYFRCKSANRP